MLALGLALSPAIHAAEMVKSILPGDVPRGESWKISVENNTDNLLVAVTIMRVEWNEKGEVTVMELYYGQWLEAGQKSVLWCVDGEYYVAHIEAFFYDKETGKATERAGTMTKEGYYDHTKKGSRIIDIRYKDPNRREA